MQLACLFLAQFPTNSHVRLTASFSHHGNHRSPQSALSLSFPFSQPHLHGPLPCHRFLPIWLVWLTVSLIPWLLKFHAVLFSGTSGHLFILDWWCPPFSCVRKQRVSTYASILAGTLRRSLKVD